MAGSKEIKRRIKSVKNTKKITKALELVSASKMKKAVNSAVESRTYATEAVRLIKKLGMQNVSEFEHPLFRPQSGERELIVVVTSNSGLCGAYNAQILRSLIHFVRNSDASYDYILIGKKSEATVRRLGGNIIASFTELPQTPDVQSVAPISEMIFDTYIKGQYRQAHMFYTDFKSALTQIATNVTLLPLSPNELDTSSTEETTVTCEPTYEVLLDRALIKLAKSRIYQMIIESVASEHSARMIAMKNASDAAGEMIGELTLAFNKARQASITQEISEISAGMASVS